MRNYDQFAFDYDHFVHFAIDNPQINLYNNIKQTTQKNVCEQIKREGDHIVQNLYGDDCREEMPSKPTGSYSVDNLGYSVNFVYPDDRETFNKFTSLDWYKNNLNKEGVKFSFRIRHTCNGEYRWVEVNVVCTRHTQDKFHVLYWLDDVQNESFADADTQNTLMSAEIGQWRLELRHDHSSKMLLSSSLQRILGIERDYSTPELIALLSKQIFEEDKNKVYESVMKLAQGDKTTFVFRWEHTSLGLRYYRCGCSCIARSERYTCFCGYGQDITEDMKQITENEQRMEAAMLEAKKANAAKTAFLSRMSHDIRTPLNGIIGLIDIDENNPDDVELLKEHRAKAKVAADHLMSLINDVLELNKLDDQNITLAHEPFSLAKMADEILTIGEMRAAEIPIIAMTANAFYEDIQRTREAGMNAHLSKPIDMKKVISVIAKFCPDHCKRPD